MTKKTLIAITAVVLVLFCTVGATLAWLVATTVEVKNTFTYGDINITLAETTTNYKMVPGGTISKDPKVTVKANSEACWLFVKIDESANFDDFMTYEIADGWTQLMDNSTPAKVVEGVFCREVSASTADQPFDVLKDNKVSVKDAVTKDDFKNLTTTNNGVTTTNNPTLTFQAYAVQKDNVATAYAAWQIANLTT